MPRAPAAVPIRNPSAQVGGTTATLRGSVEDASGAVLAAATITLLHIGTSATRTTVTDERGGFTFSSLFPGTYDVRVSCRDLRPLNDTAYTVNGIRSTGNTISLNGSNLVEAACNGLMTGVNFGTINVKRGHRVVEFVPTYSF